MIFSELLFFLDKLGLYYFFLVNLFYLTLIACSFFREKEGVIKNKLLLPPVCILVPMHNEERGIMETLQSLLNLDYPDFSIIVINDGSTDRSLELVKKKVDKKIKVIDQKKGGKGAALNAGIEATDCPLILTVDADTFVERGALLKMVSSFVKGKGIIAQGGTLRIIEDKKGGFFSRYLTGVQTVEYVRAFLYGRLGWNRLGGNLIVSGAFGLFDRAALREVGGYLVGEVSEDIELTVRLTRLMRKKMGVGGVQFVPGAVAWTKGPETADALLRQRERWHRGLIDTVIRHKQVLLNSEYGATAFVGFPYLILAEMIQPIIELIVCFGIVLSLMMRVINLNFLFLFLMATWGMHSLLTLLSLFIERNEIKRTPFEFFRLSLLAILENIGFRQLSICSRLYAFYRYFKKYKHWN